MQILVHDIFLVWFSAAILGLALTGPLMYISIVSLPVRVVSTCVAALESLTQGGVEVTYTFFSSNIPALSPHIILETAVKDTVWGGV